jgi:nucleotide-binding universal stress UspA family protein
LSGAAIAGRAATGESGVASTRPVMLLTCDVPFASVASGVAVDAAAETGAELYICDAIPLGFSSYTDQMARRFGEHDLRREMDGLARHARDRGVRTQQLVFHNPKPIAAALEVCQNEGVGLLVFGSDPERLSRRWYRSAVRRLRRDARCLLWVQD